MDIKIIPVHLGFVKAFLVKGEKTIVVDAGMKGSLKRIRRAMQANGIKPADVSLLVVSHAHADHTGGLRGLKDLTSAPVAVHPSEARYLEKGESAPAVLHSRLMKMMSGFMKGIKIASVQPDILIDGSFDLKPFGVDGYVFPTPGHTGGSLTLVAAGGDAVTGDMVGGGAMPAIPAVYANLETLKNSIAGLASHPIKRVYTSHAGIYPIGEVLELAK
jgi:hydroxyacylglutathione hydrolase